MLKILEEVNEWNIDWTLKESEKWEMSMSIVVIDWQIMGRIESGGRHSGVLKGRACMQSGSQKSGERKVERSNITLAGNFSKLIKHKTDRSEKLSNPNIVIKKKLYTMVHYSMATQWLSGKRICLQCKRRKRCGFDPWVGKIPWRRAWQPTPVFLPGESPGQRSPSGYSPWGCIKPDTAEWLTLSLS